MPPVLTCAVTFSAFGTEFNLVNAGGCRVIMPVEDPAALDTVYVNCAGSVGTWRAVM